MPLFKSTQIFKDPFFLAGWSETWYLSAANITDALDNGTTLATARSAYLSGDITITHIRTSANVPTTPPPVARRKRAASLRRVDIKGSLPELNQGDVPWNAALIRVGDSTFQVSRNMMFRGVPDNFWDFEQDKLALARFNEWRQKMINAFQASAAVILHLDNNDLLQPVPIATLQYMRMGKRNTGRPFDLLRGRKL
jgi:hypothetical protein